MMHKDEIVRRQRRSTYIVLVLVSLAIAGGRIAVVSSNEGTTAFLSANDRSRWATVASLVEHGTYAIDRQIAITDPIKRNRLPWNTIDKVRHLGPDGKQHYYSSKPPLFPTLVAGVYWVIHAVTGMTMTDQPIYIARIVLALVNLPLLAVFLISTIWSMDRICHSDWARRLGAASACFGTMMLPFTVSLNNHLAAAAATALAMCIYVRAAERLAMDHDDEVRGNVPWFWWFMAGVAAAMAAANELPALSMMVFWVGLFGWLYRRSVLPVLAGIAVVGIAFFGTNYLAHQSFRPAYAHRGNGAVIEELGGGSDVPDAALLDRVTQTLRTKGLVEQGVEVTLDDSDEENRWVARAGELQFAVLRADGAWQLAHWDDWYEYPGTYWKRENLRGVDRGEHSRLVYFLHMTVGHHGIFSLTPIWILMPVGLVIGLRFGPADYRRLTAAVLVATVVCMLFYLARPEIDRNYGGVSVCFRWLLWFAPLWLLAITPVLQKLSASSALRGTFHVLLALSAFSMSMALTSPWQSPWLYRFWQFLGWIDA